MATLDIGLAHDDLPIGNAGVRPAAPEDREQHAAEHQEMHQRLAQQPRQHGGGPQLFGVYQIGEV
jgi:hypothetical protein